MSVDFFSSRDVKALRKAKCCDSCEQPIAIGEPAKFYAGKFEGDFYNCYYHPDCREAEVAYNIEAGLGGDEHCALWYLHEERNRDAEMPEFLETIRQRWPAVLARLEDREARRARKPKEADHEIATP